MKSFVSRLRSAPSGRTALGALLSSFCVASFSLAQPPAASVPTQSDAERVATAYDTRSHDYDLVHQRIELSAVSWDSTSFIGRVTTILVARRPGLDSVTLDAGARLDISRVTTPQGAVLRTGRSRDTLVVHLARPAAMDDTVRFIVDYHAHIANGRGLTFIEPEGRSHRPNRSGVRARRRTTIIGFPRMTFPMTR